MLERSTGIHDLASRSRSVKLWFSLATQAGACKRTSPCDILDPSAHASDFARISHAGRRALESRMSLLLVPRTKSYHVNYPFSSKKKKPSCRRDQNVLDAICPTNSNWTSLGDLASQMVLVQALCILFVRLAAETKQKIN